MKKRFLSMLVLLVAVVSGAWAADELYLVVDGTSATLKYDNNKGANDPYYSSGGFAGWTNPGSVKTTATTITVDATCKNFEGTSLSALFFNFTALTSINNLENLNMANVTNISGMFRSCSKLTAIDVSSFNTAKVTNMNFLFMGCTLLTTLDLSNFNTASVESMIQMFDGCSLLENIYVGDGWNTDAVTESNNMFRSCSKLPNYASSKVDKTNAHTGEGGYLKLKPATYKVTLQEGTEDAENWTVPAEAAAGSPVTATYNGTKKVKSVKAVKKAAPPAPITVTWNSNDITGSGESFTKDGVTITASGIDFESKNFMSNGTFTTTLGNFTKIEVTAYGFSGFSGTGWSVSGQSATWTGNASSVPFSGSILGMVKFDGGNIKFVFTIVPTN